MRNSIYIAIVTLLFSCGTTTVENPIVEIDSDTLLVESSEYERDSSIEAYIATQGRFIHLLDTLNLPATITIHLDSIRTFCDRNQLDYESYYVNLDGVSQDSTILRLPLWDLQAFYIMRENSDMLITGSPSPGCGTFEIKLSSGSVLRRGRWQ